MLSVDSTSDLKLLTPTSYFQGSPSHSMLLVSLHSYRQRTQQTNKRVLSVNILRAVHRMPGTATI